MVGVVTGDVCQALFMSKVPDVISFGGGGSSSYFSRCSSVVAGRHTVLCVDGEYD